MRGLYLSEAFAIVPEAYGWGIYTNVTRSNLGAGRRDGVYIRLCVATLNYPASLVIFVDDIDAVGVGGTDNIAYKIIGKTGSPSVISRVARSSKIWIHLLLWLSHPEQSAQGIILEIPVLDTLYDLDHFAENVVFVNSWLSWRTDGTKVRVGEANHVYLRYEINLTTTRRNMTRLRQTPKPPMKRT